MSIGCDIHIWYPIPTDNDTYGYWEMSQALLRKMSTGHAAINIKLPVNETTSRLVKKLEGTKIPVKKTTLKTPLLQIDKESGEQTVTDSFAYFKEFYEIYWSFYPESGKPHTFAQYDDDCFVAYLKKNVNWDEKFKTYISPATREICPSITDFLSMIPFLKDFVKRPAFQYVDQTINPLLKHEVVRGPEKIFHVRNLSPSDIEKYDQAIKNHERAKKNLKKLTKRLNSLNVFLSLYSSYAQYLILNEEERTKFSNQARENHLCYVSAENFTESYFNRIMLKAERYQKEYSLKINKLKHTISIYDEMIGTIERDHVSLSQQADRTFSFPLALNEGEIGLDLNAMIEKMTSFCNDSARFSFFGLNCSETVLQILYEGVKHFGEDVSKILSPRGYPIGIATPYMVVSHLEQLKKAFTPPIDAHSSQYPLADDVSYFDLMCPSSSSSSADSHRSWSVAYSSERSPSVYCSKRTVREHEETTGQYEKEKYFRCS